MISFKTYENTDFMIKRTTVIFICKFYYFSYTFINSITIYLIFINIFLILKNQRNFFMQLLCLKNMNLYVVTLFRTEEEKRNRCHVSSCL